MLVSWNEDIISDKNKLYRYGSCKLVVKFRRLSDSNTWYVRHPPRILSNYSKTPVYRPHQKKEHGSSFGGAVNREDANVWTPECTSLDHIPYAVRYKPLSVGAHPGIVLVPNVDIFNFQEIQDKYQFKLETDRKAELIIHLYKRLGMVSALNEIQGEYSFILCDKERSFLVRDCSGTRELCYLEYPNQSGPVLAGLRASLLINHHHKSGQIRHVPIGSIIYNDKSKTWRRRTYSSVFSRPTYGGDIYTAPPCRSGISMLGQMRMRLRNIIKQVILGRSRYSTIGKVGLLLSGGLNSRVIGNVLRDDQVKGLKTFFIGTKTAHERVSSENGAKSISSIHNDIILDPKQAFEDIPKVIELAETYDPASVRKALLLYTVCKYIHKNSAIDVLFCGEGLDDIAGSHIFYKQAKDADEYAHQVECNLKKPIGREIYDKIASWFGITIVFPFLDPLFTAHYLSFTKEDRVPRFGIEKYFLRSCLDHSDLITEEVLWKHHEDWVDSVSSYSKFWIKTIKKLCNGKINMEDFERRGELYLHNTPLTTEEFYYREVFERMFPDQLSLVTEVYRPSFGVGSDPSPRTWNIYPQHLCIDFLHTVRVMI